jgi:hypothetical protein
MAKSTLQSRIKGVPSRMASTGKSAARTEPRKPGRSLADWKATYDKDTIVPSKVRAALKELGQSWEYESEFVRRAGVSYADLNGYRDAFADYIVTIRAESKRVWAGSVEFAQALREVL